MKRFMLSIVCAAAAAMAFADGPAAAEWAAQNQAALADINDQNLAAILKRGQAGFDELAAKIKPKGESDPVAETTFASLSQYVMRVRDGRADYAARLLAAAQKATEADICRFFIYQLRWCGLPAQANAIRAFKDSKLEGIPDLAEMVAQAVEDKITSLHERPAPDTNASKFAKEIAGLTGTALETRLVQAAASDPDRGVVRIALQAGRKDGTTEAWVKAFEAQTDSERKVMLADLLGERGDTKADAALERALVGDAKPAVAEAAAAALLKLDRAAMGRAVQPWLKALQDDRFQIARGIVRQLKTAEALDALYRAFPEATPAGKRLALEFFQERKLYTAIPFAMSALADANVDVAIGGYRVLREVADKGQAVPLTAKALATTGRVTPEAQAALAAAAKRDTTGAYQAALLSAINAAPIEQKQIALETAGRMGGAELLKAVVAAADSTDADTAASAVRALAAWDGTEVVPALMRLAVVGKTPRVQKLAARGVAQKLTAKGVNPAEFLDAWKAVKDLQGSEESKQAITPLFLKRVNIALGKPVKADVETEGGNVPANLTDGTVEKAWYGHTSPAHAIIDLGKVEKVSGAHVTFFHDGRTYTYTLEVSADGQDWKQVGGNTDAPQPATPEGIQIKFAETIARYVRLTVLKNSANQAIHVLELEVFQSAEM